ncbi:MAG: 3-deoxy-8-phosphooctulonate synthase [Myxococcales bacterium]|nr:MAG: 3-deoxy-8-phosphooctulonate synthase [Myxococcales bacterium]
MTTVNAGALSIGDGRPFVLIAGPCVIESRSHAVMMAGGLRDIAAGLGVPFIFKASYDKANRTSLQGFRGPGPDEGLDILREVRETIGVPVQSDIHAVEQAEPAARVLDVLQIPAFLCRQTDLLLAAGRTGKPVNVKKGQWMAPWDMAKVAEKIASTGNRQILLTERGAAFGYNRLITDLRSLVVMRRTGYPVVFDATHSVQLPSGQGESSGGEREFIPYLARGAAAVGVDALFMEVHDAPERALSDGPNQLRLDELPGLLKTLKDLDAIAKRTA